MRIIGIFGTCCAFLFAISGCGGGGTEPDSQVASVTLTPATVDTLFSLGETVQLNAAPRDEAGTAVGGASVTFQSSATNVASVSALGLVTSAGNGTATIMATSGSASASVVVRVRQRLVSLVLPAAASVAVTRTTAISAIPADARGVGISGLAPAFTSSDEGIVRVNASGVVTGVALGTATITANVVSPADGPRNGTTVVTVTAAPPSTATVTMKEDRFQPDTVSIAVSGTVNFVNGSGTLHDVDFGTPPMRLEAFDTGQRSLTFPTSGTLRYHCNLHIGMEAVVVVQ